MRLLNVYNLSFADFPQDELPPYAIASHRWSDDEASFVDAHENRNRESQGFKKIRDFCDFVKRRNKEEGAKRLDWLWIDTCCIDKRSSADVSENIMSMYRYYEEAQECYAYLSDVHTEKIEDFEESSWFTRGWTLQELLAPSFVLFLNASWKIMGHKCTSGEVIINDSGGEWFQCRCHCGSSSLNETIRHITKIPLSVLCKDVDPVTCDVSAVTHWALHRRTTRPEDSAYCLLGLLKVYMPIIYGEGSNAWHRILREVEKNRNSRLLQNSNEDLSVVEHRQASLRVPREPEENLRRDEGQERPPRAPSRRSKISFQELELIFNRTPMSHESSNHHSLATSNPIPKAHRGGAVRPHSSGSDRSETSFWTSPHTVTTEGNESADTKAHNMARKWKEEFKTLNSRPKTIRPDAKIPKAKLADLPRLDPPYAVGSWALPQISEIAEADDGWKMVPCQSSKHVSSLNLILGRQGVDLERFDFDSLLTNNLRDYIPNHKSFLDDHILEHLGDYDHAGVGQVPC